MPWSERIVVDADVPVDCRLNGTGVCPSPNFRQVLLRTAPRLQQTCDFIEALISGNLYQEPAVGMAGSSVRAVVE